jgi:predicted metal-dependent hydrolase
MLLFPHQFNPSEEDIKQACASQLHPRAVEGIDLFNTGKYWEAHEALEEAWKDEPGTIRALYKAILQAGVMCLHIERGNYRGAMKLHKRCMVWLTPWPNECCGLYIGELKRNLQNVLEAAIELGPKNIGQFDQSLLKPITKIGD